MMIMNKTEHQLTTEMEKNLNDLMQYALNYVVGEEKLYQVEVGLWLVTDKTIQKYNEAYRDEDKPTDVLSFNMIEEEEKQDLLDEINKGETSDLIPLGDIIVSMDAVKRQAAEYGHSEKRELNFLFLHGLLHLLGYEHASKIGEKNMFALQEEILTKMGLTRDSS